MTINKLRLNELDLSDLVFVLNKYIVNDNITMNRKWKIKMYKNDH